MNRNLLVSLFLLLAMTDARGQAYWEEAKGPWGGGFSLWPTTSAVVYGYYANGGAELYRSTDYGEHWERISMPRVDTASYQEYLWIGYSGTFYKIVSYLENFSVTRKLYRSLDDGATWTLINSSLAIITLTETVTGVLIGVAPGGPIYRSINGGATWQVVHSPLTISYYTTTTSFPDGKILLTDLGGLADFYFSTNNGLTWAERSSPVFFGTPYLVSSGTLFSIPSIGSTTMHRSTDGGATWNEVAIAFATDERPQSIMDMSNGDLLLSSDYSLYISHDDGVSWQPMPDFPEQPTGFPLIRPLPNGDLFGARRGSLFRSSDAGATWYFSAFGIRQADTRQLAFGTTDSILLAVTPTGLWRTDDGGTDWTRLLADTSSNIIYNNHLLAMLSGDSFTVSMAGQLWASANGGISFSQVTPAGGLASANKTVFSALGQYLFCSGVAGVQRSGDLGSSWSTVIPDGSMAALAEHPSGALFAFTTPMGSNAPQTLRRSTDAGATWTEISTLAVSPNQRLTLKVDINGKIYVTGYYDHSVKLAVSNDEGTSWEYKIIPDIYAGFDLAVNDIGLIYTSAGNDIQMLSSADGGDSWYYLPNYSDNTSLLNGLEISPSGRLYLVPSSGTLYRTTESTEQGAFITGHVRRDADAECSTPDAQEPLQNWNVTLDGENTFYSTTGTDGRYTFFVDTGAYTVQVTTPQNLWWGLCDSLQTVQSDSLFSTDTVDFSAIALAECPLMSVSVGVPRLRRCFDNNAYVQYCNQGSETADSAWVDVVLDEFLEFVSADLPHEALGDNTFRFQLGNITSGECGQFGLVVYVNCDSTVLGQTHCIAAHAFPDTLCTPVPNWSGATVVAEAECQDTVVALRLRNIGPVQSQLLPYIIIEDDVVLFQGQDDYQPGGVLTLERPANGHTWRIESQQEPGHPFSSVAVAFLEGCGGYESLGFVNQFGVNTFEYSWDRVCLENIGAYDPNDKQGLPLGFGDTHRIRPGQELDYMIRFQNTGTDTAFNIVVRDTLSPWLDPTSVRPGAASHPYTWGLSGEGALQFTFANILLPDSTTDLAGSQGFVRFRVSQRPEAPIGAQIFNEAAIYFDFNAPIITNRTLHTVGWDYLSSTPEAPSAGRQGRIAVWPNPVHDEAFFRRKDGQMFDGHRITVTNALGRVVWEQKISGEHGRFTRRGLPSGLYFFRVEDAAGWPVDSGKLVVGF